ncbi:calmodulin-like protein [Leishmania tarentolae]|uniref:Calmodulin-like protein n=1 Tax=Leishmania tarentolae TaxID=5689 RepID=A0A640KCI8_LEITA|nr:calmodulin-like protein [Leishmania tarentolae]
MLLVTGAPDVDCISPSCLCSSMMSGVVVGTGVHRYVASSSMRTRPFSSVGTSASSCRTSASGIFSPSVVRRVMSSESFSRPESPTSKARSAVTRSSSVGPVYGCCISLMNASYDAGSGKGRMRSLSSASVYRRPRLRRMCLRSMCDTDPVCRSSNRFHVELHSSGTEKLLAAGEAEAAAAPVTASGVVMTCT